MHRPDTQGRPAASPGTTRRARDARPREVLIITLATLAVIAVAWTVGAARQGGADPAASGAGTQAVASDTVASDTVTSDTVATAPEVGGTAPEFSTFSTAGEEITLSELRGRPVWLVFGATWCSSCRAEAPDVEAVYQQYGDRVSVVGIYIGESLSTVEDYAARATLTFPQVADMYSDIAARYGILGQPTHLFIDADGTIQAITMGALSTRSATEHVEALLAAG